jgi:phage-related minor tail protein
MASIGDVMLQLLLEDSKFQAQAVKAGEKGGASAGGAMASRLKGAIGPAVGAGIGLAFGIAAKGAAELDAATRQFQATTGATAEEAERANHAIAGMYRDNLQGFAEIGDALARVHTDLGLTGDDADRVTKLMLKFGTATGQDAGSAVSALDDILDAWNLTADESDHILDLLIASHQKYGGSIEENEAALSTMAPALTALGVGLEDGVGLLNLFAASGLDSSKAAAALNKAVKGLKPGQTLDDLIQQIASIEDPTLRAQEAIKVFGAKGGVGLANALRPGIGSLRDFVPAAEDVEGATERASDAIESSFGNQFKMILKNAGGALAEFGNNFGPLLLVAAQLGPKMIASIAGGLGALAGKLFPTLIARLLPSAIAAGTAQGAAMGGAAAVAAVATETTGVVAGQAAVGAAAAPAAAASGTLIGRTMGLAASAALLLAIPLAIAGAIALIGDQFNRGVMEELDKETADAIASGSLEALEARRDALLKIQRGQRAGHIGGPMAEAVDRQIAELEAAILNPRAATLPQFGGSSPDARDQAKTLDTISTTLIETQRQAHADLHEGFAGLRSDTVKLGDATAKIIKGVVGGAGNAQQVLDTVQYLKEIRDMFLAAGDKDRADEVSKAIAKLEPFARGRQWQAEQIAEARKVVASNKTTAEKVAALKSIEQDLLSHQRTMAAGIVAGLLKVEQGVDKLPGALKNALGGILFGGQAPGKTEDDTNTGLPKAAPAMNRSGSPDERAGGGPVRAGMPYWVGERGVPELFVPRASGAVVPMADVAQGSARGGDTYNVPITGLIRARDPFEIVTQLKRVREFVLVTPSREPA